MHISTVNICKIMTDKANVAIANTRIHMAFRLAYLHLALAHSKGQGHAHFECEYL